MTPLDSPALQLKKCQRTERHRLGCLASSEAILCVPKIADDNSILRWSVKGSEGYLGLVLRRIDGIL